MSVAVDNRDRMQWSPRCSRSSVASRWTPRCRHTASAGWNRPADSPAAPPRSPEATSPSWQYNPAAFLVIAFGILGIARDAIGAITSRSLYVSIRPHLTGWLLLGVAFVALWAHQQSNAAFIINSKA